MNKKNLLLNKYNARMSLWFLACDLLGIFISLILAYYLRVWIEGDFLHPEYYIQILWIVIIFPISYAINGLYPGVGIFPPEEMRRLTLSTSLVWVAVTALLFLTQSGKLYSRLVFSFFGILMIMIIPVLRFYGRRLGRKFNIWGEPIAIIGFGQYGKEVLHFLLNNHYYGFVPKMIVEGENDQTEIEFENTKFKRIGIDQLLNDKLIFSQDGISTVMLVPSEVDETVNRAIGLEREWGIKHLILITDLGSFGGSAIVPYDMSGILGLGIQHKLLNIGERVLKRIVDLFLTLIGGIIGLPLIIILAILIGLDSPGPAFYSQKRLGFMGKEIKVWKFRTMIKDADKVLNKYLEENVELREEWNKSQKLKDDPRVTRIGKFLRKSSLDELPQMWNVLIGNMSWVGPRPIVQDEISRYQESYSMYIQVHPGITGLWQSSGRSTTDYSHRVQLDDYYISHWSLWLDFYILLRTVKKVLKSEGAY